MAGEPGNYDLRMMYARALRDKRQFQPAARQFYEAARLKPAEPKPWTELGGMLYMAGDLPQGVIHADLFPDNVFFLGDRLSGLIDFYFACTDTLAYDVAICLNAWCFEPDHSYNVTKGRALLQAYAAVRPLSDRERAALRAAPFLPSQPTAPFSSCSVAPAVPAHRPIPRAASPMTRPMIRSSRPIAPSSTPTSSSTATP